MLNRKLNNIIIVEFVAILVVLLFAITSSKANSNHTNAASLNNSEKNKQDTVIIINDKKVELSELELIDGSSMEVVLPTKTETFADDKGFNEASNLPTPTQENKETKLCFTYSTNTGLIFETFENVSSYVSTNHPAAQIDSITSTQITINSTTFDAWEVKLSKSNGIKELYLAKDGMLIVKAKCENN